MYATKRYKWPGALADHMTGTHLQAHTMSLFGLLLFSVVALIYVAFASNFVSVYGDDILEFEPKLGKLARVPSLNSQLWR